MSISLAAKSIDFCSFILYIRINYYRTYLCSDITTDLLVLVTLQHINDLDIYPEFSVNTFRDKRNDYLLGI